MIFQGQPFRKMMFGVCCY